MSNGLLCALRGATFQFKRLSVAEMEEVKATLLGQESTLLPPVLHLMLFNISLSFYISAKSMLVR